MDAISIICCWECAVKYGATEAYLAAELRTLGSFNGGPPCFICEKEVPGSDIWVSRASFEAVRAKRAAITTESTPGRPS